MDIRIVGVDAQPGATRAAQVTELWQLTASVLREQIAAKQVSPIELTRAVLERADRLQPVLNCFITLIADHAMLAARQA